MPSVLPKFQKLWVGLFVGLIIASLTSPAFAQQPNDAFKAHFNITPAEPSGHSPTASFIQVDTGSNSHLSDVGSLQAVNDIANNSTSLEIVHPHEGKVLSSFDLSSHLHTIESASAYFQPAGHTTQLNIFVRGFIDNTPKAILVTSTSTHALTDVALRPLNDIPTLDISQLELLVGTRDGLLAIHLNANGQHVAKRLNYDFSDLSPQSEALLPFAQSHKIFHTGDSEQIFSPSAEGMDFISLTDISHVNHVALPGFGPITRFTSKGETAVVADETGKVAVIRMSKPMTITSFELPSAPADVIFAPAMNEVLAVSQDQSKIWRYSLEGNQRTTIDLGNTLVQPGSLNNATNFNITHTFTAKIGASSFRYYMNYASHYVVDHQQEIRAAERGEPVTLTIESRGSGPINDDFTQIWEYSLDEGLHWARYDQDWQQRVPDLSNTTVPLTELPEPANNIAPYLRVDVSHDGALSAEISAFGQYSTLPAESYDGLWRVRTTNSVGSLATIPVRVTFGAKPQAHEPLEFATHPKLTSNLEGGTSYFYARAIGTPAPNDLEWEIKRVGGDWESLEKTGDKISHTVEIQDHRALIRAIASNDKQRVASNNAQLSVIDPPKIQLGSAPPEAVQVLDASFNYQMNIYSHEWSREVSGSGVSVASGNGFDFSNGTGWVDPNSGAAQMTWEGTATYSPYGDTAGVKLTISNPYLAIDSNHQATLSADLYWNDGGGMSSGEVSESEGFRRVVLATFIDAQTELSDAKMNFSGTPEWDHRPYAAPSLENAKQYNKSFPGSLLNYLNADLRPWFMDTGKRPAIKPGIAIVGTATVTAHAAQTAGPIISATDPLGDNANHFARSAPRVVSQPKSISAGADEMVTLTALAVGNPSPTVKWQQLYGEKWVDIPTATSEELKLNNLALSNTTVRAVFRNQVGKITSDSAVITISAPEPSEKGATEQPEKRDKNEMKPPAVTKAKESLGNPTRRGTTKGSAVVPAKAEGAQTVNEQMLTEKNVVPPASPNTASPKADRGYPSSSQGAGSQIETTGTASQLPLLYGGAMLLLAAGCTLLIRRRYNRIPIDESPLEDSELSELTTEQ